MPAVSIMLVAAEPSGDLLGARLIQALRRRMGGEARLFGVGGPRMAKEGVESAFDIAPLSVLGVLDALRVYPLVRRRARELGEWAAREQPDLAVLIDSWGFTLRAARAIRRQAPRVRLVKYVGPQIWASRPGRARTLAHAVDELLTIHAFDAPLFRQAGLATTFVGNPVLAPAPERSERHAPRPVAGWPSSDQVLLLAPGSRRAEVDRLLAPMEDAVVRLVRGRPNLKVVMLAADSVAEIVSARARSWPTPVRVCLGQPEHELAMARATAALACSGTVTTELAMAGVPVIVAYRLDWPTYLVARALIRTPYVSLVNVAAGRAVAPELIQPECTGRKLALAVAPLLDDPLRRAAQAEAQSAALEIMRGGVADPAAAAAAAVIAALKAS